MNAKTQQEIVIVNAEKIHGLGNQQPSFKKCKACEMIKSVSEFYALREYKNGNTRYDTLCKPCRRPIARELRRIQYHDHPEQYRAYVKKYRDNDREAYRAKDREKHRRKKVKVFEAYGGAICACCGEQHFSMLTIDHMNNDGSAHRLAIGNGKKNVGSRLYQWLITNKFPSGFQVLCFNCNSSKYINGGICEHKLEEGSTTISEESRVKRLEMHGTPNRVVI
jgi:hypothetical protein